MVNYNRPLKRQKGAEMDKIKYSCGKNRKYLRHYYFDLGDNIQYDLWAYNQKELKKEITKRGLSIRNLTIN